MFAESVDHAKEILTEQFGYATEFKIIDVKLGEMPVEPSNELDLKVIN